jgi:hypothetical protein
MKSTASRALALAGIGVGAGVVAARRIGAVRRVAAGTHELPRNRWRVVTVNRSPQDVTPDGKLPEPLARLGDRIDVQVRPAPGDKGTELAARLRGEEPSGVTGAIARVRGDDPRQELRSALRESKQLLEVGEVLRSDAPEGTTKPTLTGAPLELASRRAGGEGVL